MGIVKILDKAVADKIAAGEVVERPASIVKELLENSIDAESESIIINLKKGGHESIEIIDDGSGMSPEDAKTALLRFATSKISDWEDLENIHTFGFRGEALPSIAAVSKMDVHTRERGKDTGIHIYGEGGEIIEFSETGTPEGTRICIRDLFYNTPARKKFLKSPSSETAHAVGIAQKLSLVNPGRAFRLVSNGREIFDFPSTMSIRERILNIWGFPMDREIIEIEHETPSIRVTGYVCRPDNLKSHRSNQLFFINRRYIRNIMLNQAVSEGFSPLVPQGKFPMALIFIDMITSDVDVNVHPNKLEVRFLRPGEVFRAVREAVKKGLKSFGYSPPLSFPAAGGGVDKQQSSGGGYGFSEHRGNLRGAEAGCRVSRCDDGYSTGQNTRVIGTPSLPLLFDSGEFESAAVRSKNQTAGAIGKFQALAQIENTYILGKIDEEIWIVDQHTAHERINYEKLERIGSDLSRSQRLLFPVMLDLPATLFNFLSDRIRDFGEIGFEIELFGGSSILIKSIPFGFEKLEKKETLSEIIEEVAQGQPYRNLDAFTERIRATVACKASVKAGDPLTQEEMNALVDELTEMEYSEFCPHGRPVVIKLSTDHLKRMFHRT